MEAEHNISLISDSLMGALIISDVIAIPAIVIYILTTYIIFKVTELGSKSGFMILIAQNAAECLNLTNSFIVNNVVLLSPMAFELEAFSCTIGAMNNYFWYLSVATHLMVAVNRFLAVVYFSKYQQWFKRRITNIYICSFYLAAVIYYSSYMLAGLKMCYLPSGSNDYTADMATSPNTVINWFFYTDYALTIFTVSALALLYGITLYKLRKNRRSQQIHSTTTERSRHQVLVVQTVGGVGVDGGNHSAITSEVGSGKMSSRESRLFIHFAIVTLSFIINCSLWYISYSSAASVIVSGPLLTISDTINYSINAYSFLFVSMDMRMHVVKFILCKHNL